MREKIESACIVFCIILAMGCSDAPAPARAPTATQSPTIREVNDAATDKASATNQAAVPERRMVDITTNVMSTLMAFMGERPPPPWPRGNWLMFWFHPTAAPGEIATWEDWQVLNIHTENLNEITKRLGTKTVEMVILPITNYQTTVHETVRPEQPATQNDIQKDAYKDIERSIIQKRAYALVTDARIPREWFHYEPSWHRAIDREKAREMKAAYPECFRPTP